MRENRGYYPDFGTPELHKHYEMIISGERTKEKVAQRKYPAPLDLYLERGDITLEEYEAGTRFALAWFRSGRSPRITCRYEKEVRSFGTVEDELNYYHDAELEYSEASRSIGVPYHSAVVEVCLLENYLKDIKKNKNWRLVRKDKQRLIAGLKDLAEFYENWRRRGEVR